MHRKNKRNIGGAGSAVGVVDVFILTSISLHLILFVVMIWLCEYLSQFTHRHTHKIRKTFIFFFKKIKISELLLNCGIFF